MWGRRGGGRGGVTATKLLHLHTAFYHTLGEVLTLDGGLRVALFTAQAGPFQVLAVQFITSSVHSLRFR